MHPRATKARATLTLSTVAGQRVARFPWWLYMTQTQHISLHIYTHIPRVSFFTDSLFTHVSVSDTTFPLYTVIGSHFFLSSFLKSHTHTTLSTDFSHSFEFGSMFFCTLASNTFPAYRLFFLFFRSLLKL